MRLSLLTTSTVTILLLYHGALACQCSDPFRTPSEDFDYSTVVFVGTVHGFTDRVIDARNDLVERTYQFNVKETLKGENLTSRDVTTGVTRDICYVGFGDVGTKAMVYADQRNGKLYTSLFCNRRSIEPDLHFLRMRQRKIKEPRIYGKVEREIRRKNSTWPVRIQALHETTKEKILTRADKYGFFAFNELPDGVYLVRIERIGEEPAPSQEEYRIRLGEPDTPDESPLPKKSVFLRFPVR